MVPSISLEGLTVKPTRGRVGPSVRMPPPTRTSAFVIVVGHDAQLLAEDGAAAELQKLGARVRTLDLWGDAGSVFDEEKDDALARAIVVEAGERPDLALSALRAARRDARLASTPAIVALPVRQVARLDPGGGFDDFIVVPYVPAELYARIRALEWKNSEFLTEERFKMGGLVIDRAAHEVVLDGRLITLTAKEFALLAFLAANRGRVFSREALLGRVWGARYDGGARTVDIHVRRLRAKLGQALPLETLRGAGYKLRAPAEAVEAPRGELVSRPRASGGSGRGPRGGR
jgi:DNA-binding response OmpR family regulator